MSLSLSDLVSPLTAEGIRSTMLAAADALGLQTSTWKPLDPTRTLFYLVARVVSGVTQIVYQAIAGGLLDYATGSWLSLLALNVYNVQRIEDTYAAGEITLTNAGGGLYAITAGQLTFQNSATGKTYRNTSAGTLNPTSTLTLDILAEEAGSDSTSAATDIDTMVTTLLGVTCSNAEAVIGTDAETDDELRERCRDSLGAISPNGASQAYEYIATSTTRDDGTTVDINRVRVSAESSTGEVTVIIAAPSGAPAAGDVTYVDDAIQATVVPLCVTATTQAASEKTIAVTYTAYVPNDAEETSAEIQDAVEASLEEFFASVPIGGQATTPGGTGYVFHDLVRARISDASDAIFTVTLAAPAADVAIAATEVPTLGTITPTITRVVQS